jgi:hypothetical protein
MDILVYLFPVVRPRQPETARGAIVVWRDANHERNLFLLIVPGFARVGKWSSEVGNALAGLQTSDSGEQQLTGVSGNYQMIWNADEVSNGIYYYRIRLSGRTFTGKMTKI